MFIPCNKILYTCSWAIPMNSEMSCTFSHWSSNIMYGIVLTTSEVVALFGYPLQRSPSVHIQPCLDSGVHLQIIGLKEQNYLTHLPFNCKFPLAFDHFL